MFNSLRGKGGSIRKSFGKREDIVPVPNLIEIQSSSFNDFVQLDFLPHEREIIGLEKVLRNVFPIEYEDKLSIEYVHYELGVWACTCGKLTGIENRYRWTCSACSATGCSRLDKMHTCTACKKHTARYQTCANCLSGVVIQIPTSVDECRAGGQTFSMPLRIKVQLISWTKDEVTGIKEIRDVKEQLIFFTDLPIMLDVYEDNGRFKVGSLGTFLINGIDRVIVSQLHRSPGVVFSQSKKIKDFRGKPHYLARIIPMRGSWLDFEFDSSDYLYVRIDKKKKVFVTTFLQALGFSRDTIVSLFYNFDKTVCEKGSFYQIVDQALVGRRLDKGMLPEKEEKLYGGRRLTEEAVERLNKAGIDRLEVKEAYLLNRVIGKEVIDPVTGEILVEQGTVITESVLRALSSVKSTIVYIVQSSGYALQPTIALTLAQDKTVSEEEALKELHAKLWPGDSSSLKELKERLENLFANSKFYDLTRVGRIRMNRKLGLSINESVSVLTREDIIATIQYLVNLRERGEGELDDIDHLGNRRVRLVGELLNNQMYIGFMRVERIVRERFRMQEIHSALMPQDFLNVKPLNAVIREFFGLGQLSQFMDQTNPLSEVAHKRRLSALGPGGVMKDRATFDVRDVHTSHYGRICPIETPEGQTVGLISSLATYAVVNDLGFIETAYCPVEGGKVRDEVVFLDAFEESSQYIVQTDAVPHGKGFIVEDKVFARHDGDLVYVDTHKVNYIDLSPKQLVSVSAALIPFLEHDDAVRALMGANMQRQAVPLIKVSPPLVATGMESEIVKASGSVLTARRPGVIEYVSAEKIIIRVDEKTFVHEEDWVFHGVDIYHLRKFQRSSFSTWIHHTPIVKRGERVDVGDILTNGPSIADGELALGTNVLVAFMPWHGYNFEDAIVVSERLVVDDSLTSVHIDEYVVEARDTKLGPEEITRDIPNVSESELLGLDEDGIARIGTRVKPGDILVGKVTLKGDVQYSPEEKLLRAIFGEKSREVRDTSLRVPPGGEGVVIDVKIFSRSGVRKDKRYKDEVAQQIVKLNSDYQQHEAILQQMVLEKASHILAGKKAMAGNPACAHNGHFISYDLLVKEPLEVIWSLKSSDKKINELIRSLRNTYENQLRILAGLREERVGRFKKGDILPSGVIKMIKVYVAMKRSISVGDKIAGRHGNKGVVSTIVAREDMPYMADGMPIDVVLNPLGVPSRMNVGQILETALGLVGKKLGEQIQDLLHTQGYEHVLDFLKEQYGATFINSYQESYGKEGILELGRKTAREGVAFTTPVFEGAQFDDDIKPLMEKLDLPVTGAFILRDGRTGDHFDQPVTVGIIYMMKLNHMVDDKLHARSVGPYSLVTRQPLGGKAHQGGQRLGEMEVWALEAYGAAYGLQEMLTYKSDDVSGRHKAYSAIVRGEDISEPGVPESFNVLIKELQSLGLQVDLLKVGRENVGE